MTVIVFTGIEYVLCGIVLAFVQEVNIKNEAASCEGHLQLMKTEYSCSGHGKYSGIAYLHFLFSFWVRNCVHSAVIYYFAFFYAQTAHLFHLNIVE